MIDPVATLLELAGKKPRVAVAFSGGIDSTVLAHLLVKQRRRLGSLRLIHVDHGLQAASVSWSQRCARQARTWRVPFVTLLATIARKRGESPEAVAREARYALLAEALEPGEVLVTAQHRDDQVETLLLQLFRGAGVAGLAAMPTIARFGSGSIARPLLAFTRAEIEAVARESKLRWVEDPSNSDTHYSRNFLRHRLMPSIREHWPGVDRALARTAMHMAEAQALLADRGDQDLASAADGDGITVSALHALPSARRRNALRRFIARAGVELPEASRLAEIAGPLLSARKDASPEVRWSNVRMRRHTGRLKLQVISEDTRAHPVEMVSKSWYWERDRECTLNRVGDTLALVEDAAGPIDLDRLPPALAIRARQGGERLRPGPRARTRSLKSLMQAAKIPIDDRARMPLLFVGDRLIAAGERWIDASISVTAKSRRRARLRWKWG
jgi:tRNA(Ile)-lysidine synthase